jgi:aspartate aminotransferase
VFQEIEAVPPDAILGLAERFRHDPREVKLDLTSGVYKDATGVVPKFDCVVAAERRFLDGEHTKVYLPIDGAPAYTAAVQDLVFGAAAADRLATTQTTGGTGALALVAHLLAQTVGPRRVWLSRPTWPNHAPVFRAAGHDIVEYRYYTVQDRSLDIGGMLSDLAEVAAGDVVVLHGCCHNPTGRDLSVEQWTEVVTLLAARGAVGLVDLAYLGMAEGVDEDRTFLQPLLDSGLEAFVCTSFSKNMSLYRERVGTLTVVAGDGSVAAAVQSNVKRTVRVLWSNPPSLGGQVVATVLGDEALRTQWLGELTGLRDRLNGLRAALADAIGTAGLEGFDGIATERGMFTLTGLQVEQVEWLRTEQGIYLIDSGRANIAGLTDETIPMLVEGLIAAAARPAA